MFNLRPGYHYVFSLYYWYDDVTGAGWNAYDGVFTVDYTNADLSDGTWCHVP